VRSPGRARRTVGGDDLSPVARVVAVVGGGISGLAAARVLAGGQPVSGRRDADVEKRGGGPPDGQDLEDVEVVVLEASERFGGKILSGEFQGRPVDFGPDNFLTRDPSAADLCRRLGLGDDLVPPATNSASMLARGRLRPLPAGLVLGIPTDLQALARSGIVSPTGVARAALDLVAPGEPIRASSLGLRPADGRGGRDAGRRAGEGAGGRTGTADPCEPEWTAASILERRLGHEVVRRLVDPLLGGINAGSTEQLSLAVVAPQVAQHLVGQRSVMHALRAMLAGPAGADGSGGGSGKPLFLGLLGGLGRMVTGLVADLEERNVSLRTEAEVTSLRRTTDRCELETTDGSVVADAVVLATPGYSSARLLVDSVPAAAAELGAIPYAPVVLVTLAWASGSIARLPAGSGFLVPACESRLLTGCTVLSAKWPHAAAPGEVVLRASTGRYGDERSSSMSDGELVERVVDELGKLVGAPSRPLASSIQRWPRAFPQYLPGHLRRIERARAALSGAPRIELAGASLGGIGIPACVASGERAAMSVLGRLRT
jgi:protoporphyrinogen/coproporphyrinogen III oxidase